MANPFAGLISSALKDTYRQAIEELIRGLSRPCALLYGDTVNTECPNCIVDVASRKSANVYKVGGSIPFATGQICPYCNGRGLISTDSTEIQWLAIVWNYDGRGKLGTVDFPVGSTLTICSMDLVPKLKRCKQIILDVSSSGDFDDGSDDLNNAYGATGIDLIKEHRFVRNGEPQPAGLGSHDFAITRWERP